MKSSSFKLVVTAFIAGCFALPTMAQDNSPQRLGSFAGAMKYCENEDGAQSNRYRDARRRVAKEVDGMSRQEKSRALEARDRSYNNGRFMGKRLNQQECRSLVRQSDWNRFR